MKINGFTVRNFKGIKDVSIDFYDNSKVISLLGLNESGKTTILEAISLFEKAFEEYDKNYSVLSCGVTKYKGWDFKGYISITAKITLNKEESKEIQTHHCALIKKKDCLEKIYLTYQEYFHDGRFNDKKYFFLSKNKIDENVLEQDKLDTKTISFIATIFPKIKYFSNFAFSFPEKIYLTGEVTERESVIKHSLENIFSLIQTNGNNFEKKR